jgi:cell division transport system permease protein
MSLLGKNLLAKKKSTRRSERSAEAVTASNSFANNSDSNSASGQGKQKPRGRVNAYFTHHLWVLVSSLGTLWRTPLATLMTAAVIGIALALPAGLHVLLQNVQQLSTGWEGTAQMSLFLKQGVPEKRIQSLAEKLRGWDGVAEVRYISREQALAEFRELSGFGGALESLDENPLPAVLVLRPTTEAAEPAQMELLLGRVKQLESVDLAQLDMEWVRRLSGIIEVGKRGVLLLAGLLGMAILLVVGNTIRLTILSRTQEIIVTKLIGATNAFIRRPFLYTGIWYGLMGGVLAWLLVAILLGLLSDPVSRLSFLYNSQFSLGGLDLETVAILLGSGVTLGLLGSWLAVGKHLQAIEPS